MSEERKMGMTPLSESDSRQHVYRGVKKTADAVASTLGPSGNPVIAWDKAKEDKPPIVTKDGVSVASLINITNPLQSIGSDLVKLAAGRSVAEAGDGTTTAAIFVRNIYGMGVSLIDINTLDAHTREELYKKALWHIDENMKPTFRLNRVTAKRGMDEAVKKVEEFISEVATPCDTREDINRVAYISTNSDEELSEVITDAVMETGEDGIVRYEKTKDIKVTLDIINGYKHDKPMLHESFINSKDNTCTLPNPIVVICSDVMETADHVVPYMEYASHVQRRPLVIVAKEIIGAARSILEQNAEKFSFLAVEAAGFGDNMTQQLEDLAAYTQATVIGEEQGMLSSEVEVIYDEELDKKFAVPKYQDCIGVCDRVISYHRNSDKGYTLFHNDKVSFDSIQRADRVKEQLEHAKEDMLKKLLRARVARLTGKVALINVGGESLIEIDERYDRVDDAVKAVKAAKKEGIVSGGGSVFIHAMKYLGDYISENQENIDDHKMVGYNIILLALNAPFIQMYENSTGQCEGEYFEVQKKIVELGLNYGYNAKTNQVENLIESGIIDPARVSKIALNSASATASTALSAETFIIPE